MSSNEIKRKFGRIVVENSRENGVSVHNIVPTPEKSREIFQKISPNRRSDPGRSTPDPSDEPDFSKPTSRLEDDGSN
jgi:hypothetical protein